MIDLSFYQPILEELLYRGKATIRISETYKDPKDKKYKPRVKTIYKDIPCMLSHDSKEVSSSEELPKTNQTIELFLSPEYQIPFGSEIIVEQDNKTDLFYHSGIANRYPGHQQIELTRKNTKYEKE